jgi:hypothetical protein
MLVEIVGSTFTVHGGRWAAQWLDSPNTTSSTTYTVQGRLLSTANDAELRMQQFGGSRSIITLMEIAG